jgi:hypothetical protein
MITDGYLIKNMDAVVLRSKKGLPTYIIVSGPTRSGKTTLSMQCAYYVANKLGKNFNINNVYFDAEKLRESAKGNKNAVYLLDEAAFNMMGQDWQRKEQRNMIKYMMTAAKYAPVFFICIPLLEKLSASVIEDQHTRGLETYLSKNLVQRSAKILTHDQLVYRWEALRRREYWKLRKNNGIRAKFNKQLSFMDMEKYEKMKDNAIDSIGKEEKSPTDKKLYIMNAKKHLGLTAPKIAKIFGCSSAYIRSVWADWKE